MCSLFFLSHSQSIPKSRSKISSVQCAAGVGGRGGRKRLPKDDTGICKYLMKLVEEHQHSWPFLEPVGKKEFPDYYRVIKRPMDFATMKGKLQDGR